MKSKFRTILVCLLTLTQLFACASSTYPALPPSNHQAAEQPTPAAKPLTTVASSPTVPPGQVSPQNKGTPASQAAGPVLAEGQCKRTIWRTTQEDLLYHRIVVDASGNIVPWYNPSDRCASYDHIIRLVFNFWLNMPRTPGEPDLPFYLMHRIWVPAPYYFTEGLGGDQFAMALSSWRLLYAYNGDERTLADMKLIADYVLANGLSPATHTYANIPYPYNYSKLDVLDGDLLYGEGIAQPDKAGSFGYELVNLYKITLDERYLQAAIRIADTLAANTRAGDETNSPLPFRVVTESGHSSIGLGNPYTTNFTGLLMLWEDLISLNQGNLAMYQSAHDLILTWLKTYPVHNNAWGPFFEDGPGYTVTQINAVTLAMYIMDHRDLWGPTWQADARSALDWPYAELGNNNWSAYGVQVINEQTGYRQPGNSHTSRQASMELRYAELTGDTSRVQNAIRQLDWATYMVADDGRNQYYNDSIWLTDGYGDYIRHYIRAMGAAPALAPEEQDHLLRSSSVVRNVSYKSGLITYQTFDARSVEVLRIATFTPQRVMAGDKYLTRLYSKADLETKEGYTLGAPGDPSNVLRVRHDGAQAVTISDKPFLFTFYPIVKQ